MNYSFIGFGNMASAILKGMNESGKFSSDKVYAYDKDLEKLKNGAKLYGYIPLKSALEASEAAQVIILCVKPQNLIELLPSIKENLKAKLVVTIAAGKDIAFYERILGEEVALVRVMPNINAKVKAAVIAVCPNKTAAEDGRSKVTEIFSTIGTVLPLEEEFFPLFGAIAGSSVAFVYMYIDALIRFMHEKGMDEATARRIAADSVSGSAALVSGTIEKPLILTDQVCSPGGTTIEGVTLLNNNHFEENIIAALQAIMDKDEILRKD